MARNFNGSTAQLSTNTTYLNSSAGPFTISCWFKPANLTQGGKYFFRTGTNGHWALIWEYTNDQVEFYATAYGGTNPRTGSGMTLTSTDVSNGCWIAYRYAGQAGEWSRWYNGAKTVIAASISFTLGNPVNTSYLGSAGGGGYCACDLGEFAIWTLALTDAEMAELAAGIAADQISARALVAYWPLRGVHATEPDYSATAAPFGTTALTVTNATKSAHPSIVARLTQQQYAPARVLDLYHADGTIRCASTDLLDWQDADVLGDFYSKRIKNADDIRVVEALSDRFYGVELPSTTTIICDNAGYNYGAVVLGDDPAWYVPLGEASGTTATDLSTSGLNGTYNGAPTLGITGAVQFSPATAMQCDGANDYVSRASATALNITGNCTLECWVRLDNLAAVRYLIAKGTIGFNPYQLEVDTAGYLVWRHGGADAVSSTTALTAGPWYHVAATRTGLTIQFYVNGELAGSATLGGAASTNAQDLRIGTDEGLLTYLAGALQHVAIYAAVLTPQQIRTHYQAGLDGRAAFNPNREWRGTRAVLKRYDRLSHELVTELSGVIVDADFAPGKALVALSTHDQSVLNTLIPKLSVNVDDFPSATDLGAAFPIVFGSGVPVNAPYIGVDDSADPGGRDFLVSWLRNAADSNQSIVVEAVHLDDDPSSPGLELLTTWTTGPGSPAYYSATQFAVTNDQRERYGLGFALRYKDTAGGSTWQYTWVTAYDTTNHRVTVADGGLDSGLNSVQLAADYMVENTRYSISTRPLLSVRLLGRTDASVLVIASNPAITNPADVIKEILSNSQWGLAGTCDATSFSTAATVLSGAGLATAIRGALGGRRQQRRAGDVLGELCLLRGMRLRYDADASAWKITADATPADSGLTLGLGDGVYNNIKRVGSVRRRPLRDAVASVRAHWGMLAKVSPVTTSAAATAINPNDQQWFADITTGTVGQRQDITLPWCRDSASASRVLYYLGKRLKFTDQEIECVAGQEARRLSVGDLVTVIIPYAGVNGSYRVQRIERGLADVSLTLEGYDASIFTYNASDITIGANTSSDLDPRDIEATPPGTGVNMVYNPDFSIPLRSTTIGTTMLPGWTMITDRMTAVSITSTGNVARSCVGQAYLQITTASATTAPVPNIACLAGDGASSGLMSVLPGDVLGCSVYCDQAQGWRWLVAWYTSSGSSAGTDSTPGLMPVAGDANGNGWQRYYSVARAPATAAYCWPAIIMDRVAAATYKFDAVQVEKVTRTVYRPSPWKRHPKWGVDPAMLTPGALTIRRDGEPENGTVLDFATTTLSGLSGATATATNLIPAKAMVVSVSARVTTLITGATSFQIGDGTTANKWGALVGVSLGSTSNDVSVGSYSSATSVVLTANGSNFTAGAVKLVVHYLRVVAPTS